MIDVRAGSFLGFSSTTTTLLLSRPTEGTETDDTGGHNKKFFLRASYVRATEVILLHDYNVVGERDLHFEVNNTNDLGFSSSFQLNYPLIVLEGINVTVILSDPFGLTNEEVTFILDDQSGLPPSF